MSVIQRNNAPSLYDSTPLHMEKRTTRDCAFHFNVKQLTERLTSTFSFNKSYGNVNNCLAENLKYRLGRRLTLKPLNTIIMATKACTNLFYILVAISQLSESF